MPETDQSGLSLLDRDITKDNPIWQHHTQNLQNKTGVRNEDGSVSTVRTIIMGDGQNEYLIPTVWDGKILSDEEAWNRAMSSGIDWPKAPEGEKGIASLDALDQILHKNMTATGYAEGGSVKGMEQQMSEVMAKGGIHTTDQKVDPVSGNEVPPGSLPEEVRDDVDAKLSGGEYVVPADVLRYFGVAFFEKLRAKAKMGLSDMESEGRIGGGPADDSTEGDPTDLPFNIEDLQSEDVPDDHAYATGGLTTQQTEEQKMLAAQPTFNPAQWSFSGQNYTAPTFQNPADTAETPATPTPTPVTPETPKTTTTKQGRAGVDYGGGDTKTSATGSQSTGAIANNEWAKGLNFSDTQSVNDWADSKSKSGVLGTVAKVGGALLGGGIGAGVVGGIELGNRVGQIRAAARLAEDAGNTQLSQSLKDKADKMVAGSPAQAIVSSFATGNKYYKAAKAASAATPATATTNTAKATGSNGSGTLTTKGGVTYKTSGTNSDGSWSSAKTRESTAPKSSPIPQARPSSITSKPATRTSTTSSFNTRGKATGGLITRPQKKA